MKFNKVIFCILICGLLIACNQNSLINEIEEIQDSSWTAEELKSFDFEVKDTLNGFDFYLLVRNNEDYPFRNLYLFVNLEFPNEKIARDTVYFELANKAGKWLGQGVGDLHNSEILYKMNQQFPTTGNYKISIEHGMRENELQGITDIGIAIRKNK